jgi:hypothetical protein
MMNEDARFRWDELIDRIQRLEHNANSHQSIANMVTEIHGSLKQLEDSVGDVSELDAPNIVDGLNTVIETIKIMQGE